MMNQLSNPSIRVENIDNAHPRWGDVLTSIFRTGNQHALLLCDDGWLSARQSVLAAFDGDHVVGHLCFRIEPMRSANGAAAICSKVDSFAVDPGDHETETEMLLIQTAERRARQKQCPPPRVALAAC